MRVAPEIVLTDEEDAELTQLVRSKLSGVRLTQCARIVLLAADGMKNKDIAQQVGVGRVQVSRLRERYAQSRFAGIERDLPRGAPTKVDVARLIELTTQNKPEAATHWSSRKKAAKLGVSSASVSRYWRANSLKPYIVRGFKVSREPQFIEKLEDIDGLYMSQPEYVLALCCDEKSQVQAAGPHPARSAAEEWARSDHDAGLQATWYDHAVCRAQCIGWPGHRPVPAASHARRVAEVPKED